LSPFFSHFPRFSATSAAFILPSFLQRPVFPLSSFQTVQTTRLFSAMAYAETHSLLFSLSLPPSPFFFPHRESHLFPWFRQQLVFVPFFPLSVMARSFSPSCVLSLRLFFPFFSPLLFQVPRASFYLSPLLTLFPTFPALFLFFFLADWPLGVSHLFPYPFPRLIFSWTEFGCLFDSSYRRIGSLSLSKRVFLLFSRTARPSSGPSVLPLAPNPCFSSEFFSDSP